MREDSLTPRYDRLYPLPHSTVIIDETSMVDLPMVARLLAALRPDARLILLGDANQLASVEVGSIFADILAATELDLELRSCTVRLTRNYRFSATGTLHRFCAALTARKEDAGLELLAQGGDDSEDLRLVEPPLRTLTDALALETVFQGYEAAWNEADVTAVLRAFSRRRILCAIHGGPCGVDRFNAHVESLLAGRGYFKPVPGGPYAREAVILTRNDHQLRLFNGDTGILDRREGRLEACFLEGCDVLRRVPALRLPPFSPAYAITIHRSQGSEFDDVLVVLPPAPNKCLTRELLYTAVSRARQRVTLWAREADVRECFRNGVSRASGLAQRLAGYTTGCVPSCCGSHVQ
jgi:exodeoxyribonuclease V alpha subunit